MRTTLSPPPLVNHLKSDMRLDIIILILTARDRGRFNTVSYGRRAPTCSRLLAVGYVLSLHFLFFLISRLDFSKIVLSREGRFCIYLKLTYMHVVCSVRTVYPTWHQKREAKDEQSRAAPASEGSRGWWARPQRRSSQSTGMSTRRLRKRCLVFRFLFQVYAVTGAPPYGLNPFSIKSALQSVKDVRYIQQR